MSVILSQISCSVVCSLDYGVRFGRCSTPTRMMGREVSRRGRTALLASINHASSCRSSGTPGSRSPESQVTPPGFDHVKRLAQPLLDPVAITRRVLRDRRSDPGSKYVTAEDRSAHVSEAFSVRERPSLGTPVILIDDIVTTGAMSRGHGNPVLAGMNVVAVATIAGTP